jgi:hypothetical protein
MVMKVLVALWQPVSGLGEQYTDTFVPMKVAPIDPRQRAGSRNPGRPSVAVSQR